MKIRLLIISSILMVMVQSLKSQNQVDLTLEDLIPGGKTYQKFVPKSPHKLSWLGDQLIYQKGDTIFKVSSEGAEEAYLTKDIVNKWIGSSKITNINNVYASASGNIIAYAPNEEIIIDPIKGEIVTAFETKAEMKNKEYSPSQDLLAFTIDNNLYIKDGQGVEKTITSDSNKRIVNGQSVHQNEFGINKGIFWSPNSQKLAFYRMDESMVGVYPLVNTNKRMAEEVDRVYPMAGLKSHHVTVGVYDINSGDTVFLKTGLPKEKYLTNIAWSPNADEIYIAELNRGQDTLQLNVYDAISGVKKRHLFTEISSRYVEPEHPVLFVKNAPKQFIWQSKKDGHNHLYLYNTDGKLLKQLTKGNFDVLDVLGMDEKGNEIYFMSNEGSPLENKYYKLNIKSGRKELITPEKGVHRAQLNKSGTYLTDWYSSQNNPRTIDIVDIKKNKQTTFFQAQDPFEGYKMPEIQVGTVKAADDTTDLYYRMVLPTNFDASKKYPVIVYVYGGPHSQFVVDSWQGGARGWDIYMAQKGYIVFSMDNRGTYNRGTKFEQVTHRQLGVEETKDQMKGIEFLSTLPYTDMDRVGVHGWSYGGFMTLNMMLRHPEVFKVGVAGGPVVDWKYYEIMYGERYMDHPSENVAGYKESSMLNHIKNLQGRLLLIHGDMDPVVLMQHTSQLLRSAVKEGVHPDLFIYPGHEHNVMGKDRIHLHEHITRYFDDFLK